MAKASGSIDLKAEKAAHDDAATKATNYITKVDNDGISIHPYNDSTDTAITKDRAVVTSGGMEVYRNDVSVASFGTTARIGSTANDATRTEITAGGLQVYKKNGDADVQIANLGYGEGNSESATGTAPYYTLGERKSTTTEYSSSQTYGVGALCVRNNNLYVCTSPISTPEAFNTSHWRLAVGNYSLAEGYDNIASGANSHAEGWDTMALGAQSHAEGTGTYASGTVSHAEGDGSYATGEVAHAEGFATIASGNYCHAEGNNTQADGNYSHAQNYGTWARSRSQTVIGEWNVSDAAGSASTRGTYALIIGNGVETDGSHTFSNALTVEWNGNVDIASGAKYKINGTALSASDVNAVPTTRTVNSKALSSDITLSASDLSIADFITEQGVSGIWSYRKWNSGTYEAWGEYQASSMTLTTASGGTYYGSNGSKEISLPSWSTGCTFASGTEQASHSSGVYIYNIARSASKLTVDYRAHASTSDAICGGCFYIKGTWS